MFGLALILIPGLSPAQEYPSRPITVIVTTGAGNTYDILVRALCDEAKKSLGQPFIYENKAGAGGTVGLTSLSKAKPDGYTLAVCTPSPLVRVTQLRKMSYSLEDFVPIMLFGDSVTGLVVRADSGWKTLKDVVEYGKKNPKKLRCAASSSPGSPKEIALRYIAKQEGIDWLYVPYAEGDGPALTDLLGGHIEVISAAPIWKPHVQAGTLRLLAVYLRKRLAEYPNVPTLVELKYDYVNDSPYGILAPKGTPPSIVKKLDNALHKAQDEPGFRTAMKNLETEVIYVNSEDSRKQYEDMRTRWADIIKQFNIPVEGGS